MAHFGMLLRLAVRLVWNEGWHIAPLSENPAAFIMALKSGILRKDLREPASSANVA
jgi:hypothetical protein